MVGCKSKTPLGDNNSLPTAKNIQRSRKNIKNRIDLSSPNYTDNNFSGFLVINVYETLARSVNSYDIENWLQKLPLQSLEIVKLTSP